MRTCKKTVHYTIDKRTFLATNTLVIKTAAVGQGERGVARLGLSHLFIIHPHIFLPKIYHLTRRLHIHNLVYILIKNSVYAAMIHDWGECQ